MATLTGGDNSFWDESPVACYCDKCGAEIFENDDFYGVTGGTICGSCFDEIMSEEDEEE